MTLRIRLYGNLRRFMRDRLEKVTLETAEPIAIPDLLRRLGIPEEEVWTVAINGVLVRDDRQAVPGDEIEFFSPVAGGCCQ